MSAAPHEKVAVSLPADLVRQAHAEVQAGRARSLSAYVAQAVAEKQQRDDLEAVLDAMDVEFGRPSDEEEAWARDVLGLSRS
jgi:Arc/MetJ-type ribon-helix-helix transcriptional regulator